MRRTGKDLDSPATGSEACGGAGMTKEAAFMKGLGGFQEECGTALRGCADRRQTWMGCFALLQADERRVAAAAAQQVVMPAALDDLAALDHKDRVGVHDGVQAMRDHDRGAVLAEMLDRFLHLLFGFGIERGRGLVKQDDRRVL